MQVCCSAHRENLSVHDSASLIVLLSGRRCRASCLVLLPDDAVLWGSCGLLRRMRLQDVHLTRGRRNPLRKRPLRCCPAHGEVFSVRAIEKVTADRVVVASTGVLHDGCWVRRLRMLPLSRREPEASVGENCRCCTHFWQWSRKGLIQFLRRTALAGSSDARSGSGLTVQRELL